MSDRDNKVKEVLGKLDPILADAEVHLEDYKRLLERLNDNKALEQIIYDVFYASPIEGARANLAKGIQLYLTGQPLKSPDEIQQDFLASLTWEERGEWHRKKNLG